MAARRRLTARRGATLVVGVVVAALVTAAAVAQGFPAADLRLNDGSVWVTNSRALLSGKLNAQIDELSSGVTMANNQFDLMQDGSTVLARDLRSNLLQPIDTGQSTLGTPAQLPANAVVALGARTVAVVNPTTGGLWARDAGAVFGVDLVKGRPDLELGAGALATVTTAGAAIGLSVQRGELVRLRDGQPETTKLPFGVQAGQVQLSAVGDRAVVLDRAGGRVWVEGDDPIAVPDAASAQLQQPSAAGLVSAGDALGAVLTTSSGLFGVAAKRLVGLSGLAGTPAQPVVVGGCAYAAATAAGRGEAAVVCQAADLGRPVSENRQPIPQLPADARLVFRVNRDVVVLNDTVSGNVWLPNENLRLIAGWDKITPPKPERGDTDNSDQTERIDPNRDGPNRPPDARDDALTIRAGRSTVVPVMDNDSDPDGDILTVSADPKVTGTAQPVVADRIRGGTALQLTAPSDATGVARFSYTVDDGRGGKDTAAVSVQIVSADQTAVNAGPVALPRSADPVTVGLGRSATWRVLPSWRDPEGDDLFLVGATVAGDDEVTSTPDGSITYTDAGVSAGRKEISITVSDGVAVTEGTVVVTVRKDRRVPPVVFGDYAQTRVGQTITVRPLDNDLGSDLNLSRVQPAAAGPQVVPDFDAGTFTFRATKPGTFYVQYLVDNGQRDFGLVRVDVREAGRTNVAPVAARDMALLPAGGSVLVDPLANDEDADDDVLVLQATSSDPAVSVRMIQRQLLEITAVGAIRSSVQLSYTVSDGQHTVPGTIVLLPTPAGQDRRPEAKNDEVIVRAGSTATVRVLRNDSSPVGLDLTVDQKLPELPSAGTAWSDGEEVRFAAPAQAGEYTAVYQLRDSDGRTASAQVRFTVVAANDTNTAPAAPPVIGRVLAGTSSKIIVPLDGVDPDGDTVRLLGLASAPRLGRVVAVDEKWLVYEAYPDSAGTDTFGYAITDARGARSIGTVRVGVVPRAAANTPPVAEDDHVTTRPGRTVRVPVLANDSDPDGDAFGFDSPALDFAAVNRASVVDGDSVQLATGSKAGRTVGRYQIVDARGGTTTGSVTIEADPTAPLLTPVLADDVVAAADVAQREVIDVPVLDNDYDPDGDITAATVAVPAYGAPADTAATVVGVGRDQKVRVHVADTLQTLRYQVTDTDGQLGWAVITVPGRADSIPALRLGISTQVVKAGEPLDLAINDFVIGTRGRTVILTTEQLAATHGTPTQTSSTAVRFVSPVDYAGPASITFEVTDGRRRDDQSGRTAVLSIPIKVLPADNRAPTAEPVTITVGAGEPARTVDLANAAEDPDGDRLSFTDPVGDREDGVVVTRRDSTVTVRTDADARPGASFTLRSTVRDPAGLSTELVITVVVRSTAKPLPRAVDDSVDDAYQGRPVEVSALGNDVNPFPDTPLRIVATQLESGQATVGSTASAVRITPAEDFVGTVVVRYTIQDATGDVERQSQGAIRVTVLGKPSRPGVPREVEVGNRQAVVTFTAPADNGRPISRYTVTENGSGRTHACASTTCTLTGLTNNQVYRFTVTATNAVGVSDPSGRSGEIRPDVRPGRVATPAVTWGDGTVTATWSPPTNQGSPLLSYTLELASPDGRTPTKVAASQTSYTWKGLRNGQSYRVRVQATNSADRPGDFSGLSKAVVPAGPPSPPTGISAAAVPVSDGTTLSTDAQVGWAQPADLNGARVETYLIFANGEQKASVTATGAARQETRFPVAANTTYQITVVAKHRGGTSSASDAATITSWSPLAATAKPALVASTDGNPTVTVQWSPAPSNGGSVSYWVELAPGGRAQLTAPSQTFGSAYGQSTTARIQACQTQGSQQQCGAWSPTSDAAAPYAPPPAPQVSASKPDGQHVTFRWSVASPANGKAVARTEYRINDQTAWQRVNATSGTADRGPTYATTYTIEVRAVNAAGQAGPAATASARTDDPPQPTIRAHKGADYNGEFGACNDPSCAWVAAELSNFPAGSTQSCRAENRPEHTGFPPFSTKQISINGNGSGSNDRMGFYGWSGDEVRVVCGSVQSPWFTW